MHGSVPDVLRTDLPMKYGDSAFHSFIRSRRNANFLIEICFQTSPGYFDRIVLIHKQTVRISQNHHSIIFEFGKVNSTTGSYTAEMELETNLVYQNLMFRTSNC